MRYRGERVGYQGEPGAFSEEAVLMLFPGSTPVPNRDLRSIFEAVKGSALRYGVVPLENSQAGSINETYDLLARFGVSIVGEVVVSVDHALLALPGTRLEDVRRVSSHPQALAQCQEFLATLDAEVVPEYDTAGAARRIAVERRTGEAAIAAARAADLYELQVLADRVQTYSDNRTRFAAICADPAPLAQADKTSILYQVRNEPGALYRSLGPLAARGINLSKLESRPIGDIPWQWRFYVDVDAGLDDPAFREALRDLEAEVIVLQVLGTYARWTEGPAEATGSG
jgi:prephenate dehydratase